MKPIKLAPFYKELKTALFKEFNSKVADINRSTTLNLSLSVADLFRTKYAGHPKCTVTFTPDAYLKMQALTRQCSTEIAAHGVVEKLDAQHYLIKDILVYPQKVTAATVAATDDYGPWLMELPDDTFNHLRFQWHSHVNMNTSPSGVDDNWYETLLKDVEDFYIFMITNKRNEHFINVYDVTENLIYETSDITVTVVAEDNCDIFDWAQSQIKEHLEEPVKPASTYASYYDHHPYSNLGQTPSNLINERSYYNSEGRLCYNDRAKELLDKAETKTTKPAQKKRGRPPKNSSKQPTAQSTASSIYELEDDDEIERAAFLSYLRTGGM